MFARTVLSFRNSLPDLSNVAYVFIYLFFFSDHFSIQLLANFISDLFLFFIVDHSFLLQPDFLPTSYNNEDKGDPLPDNHPSAPPKNPENTVLDLNFPNFFFPSLFVFDFLIIISNQC